MLQHVYSTQDGGLSGVVGADEDVYLIQFNITGIHERSEVLKSD
jgi:hypothetical protein